MKLFENEILHLLGNRVITILCSTLYMHCSNCVFSEEILCKLRYFQATTPNKFLTSFDCFNQDKIYKQLKIN